MGRCELCQYLNNDFLNSFGSEKNRIVQVTNANSENPWYGIAGGSSTADKVFLLSIEEVVEYFGDSGQLRERPRGKYWIGDQYKKNRVAEYDNTPSWWWLRSPGYLSDRAAFVNNDGYVFYHGYLISSTVGVRPALWINLDSEIF
jgi:hypothetical protein